MSEYKNIIGKGVRFLSSNLDNDQAEGQIWYNSTDDAFKNLLINEAWASGSPMIFNRAYIAGFGTQTAAIGCGGYNSPPATFETATEEYNGSGFSTGGALNTGRWGIRGAGSQTAGLAFFGIVPGSPNRSVATEEYNGTSWTNGGNLSEGRYQGAAAGTQTAGLAFGGGPATASPPVTTATEEYDGSSWTNGGALNTAIRDNASASAAPQTAAISFGGSNASTFSAQSEEYNGSSWTVVNSMSLARSVLGGSGIQTSALGYGGAGTPSNSINKTEAYDGTNWSTSPADLATGRRYLAGAGSNGSSAVAFQGKSGSTNTVLTEEYNKSVNVITAGAWASGGNMNSGRSSAAGFANKDDLVVAGGFIGSPAPADDDSQNLVEEYNGASWTAVTAMPTKRSSASGCGASQTSGMVSGGIHTNQTTSVEYDGTNWTSGGSIPQVSRMAAHCGTVPAALRCGGAGNPGPAINETIEYDGSSWTAGNTMPHSEYGHMLVGTQTAAVFSGGHNSPTRDNLYEYDGTNWTTSPATLAVSLNNNAGAAANGTQTAAMWFLGSSGTTASQIYNGTSVVTQPSLGTSRYNVNCGGGGTSTAAIVGGGDNDLDATEEFTGETSALNIKTLTTS